MNNEQLLRQKGYRPHSTDLDIKNQNLICTPSIEQGISKNDKGIFKLYRAVSCTKESNDLPEFSFELIDYDTIKEIALSADILYTDLGIGVHSHSMKTTFKTLKIVRI